jgi:hypothetical protein
MVRAYCEGCEDHVESGIKHVLSEADGGPETLLECSRCEAIIAALQGHVLISLPLAEELDLKPS